MPSFQEAAGSSMALSTPFPARASSGTVCYHAYYLVPETWILNSTLLQKLASFQAELAKRILQLPTCTSNNTALMALQWPSMRARILIIKLCFLFKIVNSDLTLSVHVFRSLAASDVESLVIIHQCRFLESIYKSNYTTAVLTSDGISNHSLKKEILQLYLFLLAILLKRLHLRDMA